MSKKKRIIYFTADILIALVLFGIDRVTKTIARGTLMVNGPKELIRGIFELQYLENRGAAFGMLQNQRILFIIVGVVFMALMLCALAFLPATEKYRALRICLCLLIAGAAGNLYDRITLNYVIDFFYISYINFPVFNVADVYVTTATAVLVILLMFFYREEDLDLKKVYAVRVHSSMIGNATDKEEEINWEIKEEKGEKEEKEEDIEEKEEKEDKQDKEDKEDKKEKEEVKDER